MIDRMVEQTGPHSEETLKWTPMTCVILPVVLRVARIQHPPRGPSHRLPRSDNQVKHTSWLRNRQDRSIIHQINGHFSL
jgi:hypothetical protein